MIGKDAELPPIGSSDIYTNIYTEDGKDGTLCRVVANQKRVYTHKHVHRRSGREWQNRTHTNPKTE